MIKYKIEKKRFRGDRPNRPEWLCNKKEHFSKARDTWYKINKKCYNKTCKDYKYYGARGINVYEPWKDNLDLFYNYCINLENCFKKEYSIDRINNDGNYEPGNIRFVVHKVQCNNRRSNRVYEYNNKKQTMTEWAEEYGLKWGLVRDRLDWGWSIHEALTKGHYGRKS